MAPIVATPISESLDITDFVVTKGNGVKGLSEMGPKTLPREYIQPLEERISVNNIMTIESIPIINMSNWYEPKVSKSICDAAEKLGFFQKKTHLPTMCGLAQALDLKQRILLNGKITLASFMCQRLRPLHCDLMCASKKA